jgi:hypothetical protein
MARIPSADDLGMRAPVAIAAPVGRKVFSTALDLRAVETTAAQKGIKEWGDTVANEELATAEVQFQIGAMAEAEKYKNDTDFDTIEERHAAGMQDQLGKSAANITSRKNREMFMIRGEEGVAKANAIMNKRVTEKKNDRERAHSASAIDLLVKGAMDLETGDPAEAALGIQLTLDSMVERDVISAVDGQKMARTAQLDMAYGRLKSMNPQQQLEIINSTDPKVKKWLDDVPPDVVRQLKTQAENAEMGDIAMDYAMGQRGNDDALNEMYAKSVEEDWGEKLTTKTRTQILRLQQDDELMRQNDLTDYYEEGAASIRSGETTLKQMESTPGGIAEIKKLSEAQYRNLVEADDNAVERAAGRGRKYSDLEVKNRLKGYMASGAYIEGRKYWSENFAKLNDSDFKYFNVATSPTKSNAPEWDPIRSARQLLGEHKKQNPSMTDVQETEIWDRIDEQALTYYTQNGGKKAPDAEVNQWIETEFIKVKHKKNWWPDEELFLYEMEPKQRVQVTDQLKFLQEATGWDRSTVGDLLSGHSNETYDFVPKMNEALGVVRERYPNEKPFEHWARIKNMLNLNEAAAAEPRVDEESPAGNSGLGLVIPGQ